MAYSKIQQNFPHVCLTIFAIVLSFLTPQAFCQNSPKLEYEYEVPMQLSDGWKTSSLGDVNIDSKKVAEMVQNILNSNIEDVHSVVLVKSGKLVLEEYFSGYNRETKHKLASATKSISSILTGIAIDKKLIRNLDLKVYELFPEYKGTKWIDRKYDITLRHILSMTAGIDWIEWRADVPLSHPRNDLAGLYRSDNPIRYTFEKELLEPPAKQFNYSTGLSTLLGEVLKKTSGLSADKFAEKYLFDPLGISDRDWFIYPNGAIDTGGGLFLRPRDMAKIGYMMLNDGKWQHKQIVSTHWVKESTKNQVHQTGSWFVSPGYGYQWRLSERKMMGKSIRTFYAAGLGGQYIFIFPPLDLVVVFTHKHPESKGDLSSQLMLTKYIIPAVLPPTQVQNAIKLEPKILKEYVGEYGIGMGKLTIFRKDADLYVHDSEGKQARLVAEAENAFSFNAEDLGIKIPITFNRSNKGKVTSLILFIGFNRLQLDKIK